MSLLRSLVVHAFILARLYARVSYRKVEIRLLNHKIRNNTADIEDLQELVGHTFRAITPECSGVRWTLLNSMGYACDENGERVVPICWNAPVTITVYLEGRPYFGLGIEFRDDALCIRQMQGVRGAVPPQRLRRWPRLLVEICMHYAQHKEMKEVRVYKADQDVHFLHPALTVEDGEDYDAAYKENQKRMRLRYDVTARRLKFQEKKRYYSWLVPPRA